MLMFPVNVKQCNQCCHWEVENVHADETKALQGKPRAQPMQKKHVLVRSLYLFWGVMAWPFCYKGKSWHTAFSFLGKEGPDADWILQNCSHPEPSGDEL